MRSLEFHPEAQAELISAAQYFEREAENLGVNFIDFVQRTALRLVQFPASGRRVGRRLRRVVVPRRTGTPPQQPRKAHQLQLERIVEAEKGLQEQKTSVRQRADAIEKEERELAELTRQSLEELQKLAGMSAAELL